MATAYEKGLIGPLIEVNPIETPEFLVATSGAGLGQVRLLESFSNRKQTRLFQSYSYKGRACAGRLHRDAWGTSEGDVDAPTSSVIV